MAKTKRRKLIDKLDKVWSDKIKEGGKCEYCGKTKYLNAHHIFSRSNYSVRWDCDNGICLCVGCHSFSSKFSAHKTPLEFAEWVKEYRGNDWFNRLLIKKNIIIKYNDKDLEELLSLK